MLHADELFTKEACHKFLKQCIRNSKQRLENVNHLRMPVARNRRKNISNLFDDEEFLEEDSTEEADESGDGFAEKVADEDTDGAANGE